MTYIDAMISVVKFASGNRVAQVHVTYLGDVIIYPLAHRKEAHTLLSCYFMNYGVPDHVHSDNAW